MRQNRRDELAITKAYYFVPSINFARSNVAQGRAQTRAQSDKSCAQNRRDKIAITKAYYFVPDIWSDQMELNVKLVQLTAQVELL